MIHSRSKQLTDSQKLQILRNQLYGKQEMVVIPKQSTVKLTTLTQDFENHPAKEEAIFLRQDLIKILLLASLAIISQVLLLISLNLKLIKF